MSKLQEMLGMNGGSFELAAAMGHKFIKDGHHEVWLDLSVLTWRAQLSQGDSK